MRTGARAELECCSKTGLSASDGVALRQNDSRNGNESATAGGGHGAAHGVRAVDYCLRLLVRECRLEHHLDYYG